MRTLRDAGFTVLDIAEIVGATRPTVYRYLALGGPPERQRPQRSKRRVLAPYEAYLIQRWAEGCRNRSRLFREIRLLGYQHSARTVSLFLKRLSDEQPSASSAAPPRQTLTRVPSARHVACLLVWRKERLPEEERDVSAAALRPGADDRPSPTSWPRSSSRWRVSGRAIGSMPASRGRGPAVELLTRRPDIQNAEAQLLGANADIKAARAAFFPTISLTGQYGYQSAALYSMFTGPGLFYSIAASMIAPIFSGGQLEGQLELNKARYEELLQNYRKAVISSFSDVENSLTITQQTAEQQRLQEDAVEQARIAFELADARYRAGAVDLLTVLD